MVKIFAASLLIAATFTTVMCAAPPSSINADEKAFIEFAGQTDLVNVRLAQMAQMQASSPQVKHFAEELERNHAADLKRLTAVAQQTGVNAPSTLDEVHKNFIERLKKAKGKEFDLAFLKTVVNEHENAYVPFKREADNGFNPHLKAYARTAVRHLDAHLKEARRLASTVH